MTQSEAERMVEEEREACATLCDGFVQASCAAEAIRARGQPRPWEIAQMNPREVERPASRLLPWQWRIILGGMWATAEKWGPSYEQFALAAEEVMAKAMADQEEQGEAVKGERVRQSEVNRLEDEVRRLRWRLNHQTEEDMAACRSGLHGPDCGAQEGV